MQVMSDEQFQHRVLGGVSRSRLLAILGESGRWLTVRDLAGNAGPRANTTREHLDQLVAAGLVERRLAEPRGRGRPAFQYRAKRRVDDAGAYRALAGVLADAVAQRHDPAGDAIAAGERWGKKLVQAPLESSTAPVDQLVELLDELGFDPSLTVADSVIELRRCPFGSLARTQGNVVCNVHLGLMRGALRQLDSPTQTLSLVPFVAPSLCLAHLGAGGDVG